SLAVEKGLDLRSRCLLWPDGPAEWELLDAPGQPPVRYSLDSQAAISVLQGAVKAAQSAGLKWLEKPLPLEASSELVKLVRKSQELARHEAFLASGHATTSFTWCGKG